jgi:integrase/recombinase XerD
MKLSRLVVDYLAYRRALGNRFASEERVLRSFCRHMQDAELEDVTAGRTRDSLLNGRASLATAVKKRGILEGLYRYGQGRGYGALPPLPPLPTVPRSSFVPYIYSEADLRRLLSAASEVCAVRRSLVDDYTLRALLLTLYGAGLRLGEALRLNHADVDLREAVLTVRETKFFKTRLVPIGRDLLRILIDYRERQEARHASGLDAPFFCLRNGAPMNKPIVERTFRRLRAAASVEREDGIGPQPRLHDLRHTAAVHRLLRWYRTGVDLQQQLQRLATYLGHKDLSGTQRYLTLTPQLMDAAGRRFERYATEGRHV